MARSINADTNQPENVKQMAYYVIGSVFFNKVCQPENRVFDLIAALRTKINAVLRDANLSAGLRRNIIMVAQDPTSLAAAFVLVGNVAIQHMRHTVHVPQYSRRDLARWQTGVDVIEFPGGGVCVFDECAQINFATLLGVNMDPMPAIILE
jgi:hypothetical protein